MSDRRHSAVFTAFFQAKLLSEHSQYKYLPLLAFVLVVLSFGPAQAQSAQGPMPSLATFVQAARTQNLDNREAEITQRQRLAELEQSRYRLVPTLAASAGYTFNQFAAVVTVPSGNGGAPQSITITPQNQLEAGVTLTVPLVDVGNWLRIGAAEANSQGAEQRAQATALSIDRRVAQAYYQVIATGALVQSSSRALQVAEASLAIVTQRMAGGFAGPLENARASADVLRARQTVADAELLRSLAGHALQSLTGLAAEGATPPVVASTEAPPSLQSMRDRLSQLPTVRATQHERVASERTESAAWMVLLPTVNATAQERITNASGFAGQNAYFSAGLTLSWRADLGALPAARALGTATAASRIREARALQNAEDDLFEAWQRVRFALVRSEAAHAQELVSVRAVSQARERLTAGTATPLDLMQLERDSFSAEVARIQADADLLLARAVLRNAAGYSLEIEAAR